MSFFGKIKSVLQKTADKITNKVSDLLYKKSLTDNDLELLEEALLSIDVGVTHTNKIIDFLKSKRFEPEHTQSDLKTYLSNYIYENIKDSESFIEIKHTPTVIILCGVNGSGKTTMIGKIANYYKNMHMKVSIAACDTFRAAAVDQLEIWAQRANVEFIRGKDSQDPASVAYQALQHAIDNNIDILLLDTAGRLQNYHNLMEELSKFCKVLSKIDDTAPHYSILVLDSTIGQNAIVQVEQFKNIANLNGLILTKLDGTAKGGVVIPIIDKFHLPIYFIGIGEKIDDIKVFSASEFSSSLFEK